MIKKEQREGYGVHKALKHNASDKHTISVSLKIIVLYESQSQQRLIPHDSDDDILHSDHLASGLCLLSGVFVLLGGLDNGDSLEDKQS